MENKLSEKKRWPPFCCVPAFIEQALAQCNVKIDDLRSFAHQLGVRVGAGEENPWGLEVTEDPDARGLTATSAADVVPRWFSVHCPLLGFRHIRFDMVTLHLYDCLLSEMFANDCVVGVGFDYPWLLGRVTSSRHVSRILRADEHFVVLTDDSGYAEFTEKEVSWDKMEAAVHRVNDGFWVVGAISHLKSKFG